MSRVVHFEIHASNPEAVVQFYTELLGWKITKWDGPVDYWLIQTGSTTEPGIDGGLMPRRGDGPLEMQAVNAFVCTVGVADLDATLTRVTELGGVIALPKMAVPGVGWLAYAKDTDGNIFGMLQPDATAA